MATLLLFVLFPALLWESFQTQEQFHSFAHCNETLLNYISKTCQIDFHQEMQNNKKELWCDWEQVIRPYNRLTMCMEYVAEALNCFFPNHIVQDAFIHIHALYFQHCPDQHEGFIDAPQCVVITLTLVPVSLIPALVFLVVWKSKVRD
ncbi:hypothetical protein JZ751_026510 [Albula glossodonta]|uniref:Receptor activity modifying protein 2 n=1 Tax=Albula glossodonta TaxID=121402 RepID=A0A8T2PLQ5_9TELE|nr:hypothetical protein JZ751_026510 [Albula glossodonta]